MSWRVSTSSGSAASGSMVMDFISCAPVMTTSTAPPPAVALNSFSSRAFLFSSIWRCMRCACFIRLFMLPGIPPVNPPLLAIFSSVKKSLCYYKNSFSVSCILSSVCSTCPVCLIYNSYRPCRSSEGHLHRIRAGENSGGDLLRHFPGVAAAPRTPAAYMSSVSTDMRIAPGSTSESKST